MIFSDHFETAPSLLGMILCRHFACLHITDGAFLAVFSERRIKVTEIQFSRDNIVAIILQKYLSFVINSS